LKVLALGGEGLIEVEMPESQLERCPKCGQLQSPAVGGLVRKAVCDGCSSDKEPMWGFKVDRDLVTGEDEFDLCEKCVGKLLREILEKWAP